MSITMYQNKVNSLDQEIARAEAKKAGYEKTFAEKQARIDSVQASILRSTSDSVRASKNREIARITREAVDASKRIADEGKRIAQLRQKRNDAYKYLQRAEQEERKKQMQREKNLHKLYEGLVDSQRIGEQKQLFASKAGSQLLEQDKAPMQEYDVFISHATEDKESFVDYLVQELKLLKVKVWYDSDRIKWGDSLRAEIDRGLLLSKFGIVVISPDYIAEGKYWTKAELDGLFLLESRVSSRLMPIWHNISKLEVVNFSPILAGRKALTTASMTPEEIARQFAKLVESSESEELSE